MPAVNPFACQMCTGSLFAKALGRIGSFRNIISYAPVALRGVNSVSACFSVISSCPSPTQARRVGHFVDFAMCVPLMYVAYS